MSKKCTPLWLEAHFEVNVVKNWRSRTTFGIWDVGKVHAVVARSTSPSQNEQSTPGSDNFLKLTCRKSAHRCGAKHISKSKCSKRHMFAQLLEVRMLKKCTPLWREAHFQVKMYKTHHVRTTFGRSDVVSCGRRNGWCTLSKVSKTWGFCSSANYNHHHTTRNYIPLHSTPLHYTTLQLRLQLQMQLHYIALITLHYTTLHNTAQHNATLHYTRLHYTTLHYITLHSLHQHKRNCNCTTLITLHHNYNSTTPQLYNYSCTTPRYIQQLWVRWRPGDHCNHCNHTKKHNSNHLSVRQWIRSAILESQQPTSPIGFQFLKLPSPPCAALLVRDNCCYPIH